MNAMIFNQFGSSNVLEIAHIQKPTAAANQVLIRVEHTSVNPVDWKIRQGYLSNLMPHEFPIVPGWDVAGVIESVGSEVTQFGVGDAVYAYARKPVVQGGTYAEYVTVDAEAVAVRPTTFGSAEAASVPLVGLTAWQALHDVGGIQASDTVLITAGAGGVGSFAIQFAKLAGARVVTTASPRNHGYLRELGADVVVDYNREDVVEQLRQAAPDGFSLVFDAAGGTALESAWQVIRTGGRLISIVDSPDAERAKKQGVNAFFHFVSPNGHQLAAIAELVDRGQLRLPALAVRNIKDAASAHDENQAGHTRGKVVLEVAF
jgi:NADPH2:quinone reductase